MLRFGRAVAASVIAAEIAALQLEEKITVREGRSVESEQAMMNGDAAAHEELEELIADLESTGRLSATGAEQLSAGAAWTNNEVRYCWAKDMGAKAKVGMVSAFKHYDEKMPGCINFIEIDRESVARADGKWYCKGYPAVPSIYVQSTDSGCYATGLGELNSNSRQYYRQRINIGQWCESMSTCVHEVGHAIGMAHEQTRPDRDDNITVNVANIQSGWASQFAKNNKGFDSKPYCYHSVMHYGMYAASGNGKAVMVPKNCSTAWGSPSTCPTYFGDEGSASSAGLQACDIEQLKMTYKCTGSGPVAPPSNCKDDFTNCASFSSYCSSVSILKNTYCKKTCGAC